MNTVKSLEQLDEILHAPTAVIFKHSTRCPVSSEAYSEISRFAKNQNNVPVFIVNVIEQRPLSDHITQQTNILHESPQIIVIRNGRPAWNASHWDVTAAACEKAIRQV